MLKASTSSGAPNGGLNLGLRACAVSRSAQVRDTLYRSVFSALEPQVLSAKLAQTTNSMNTMDKHRARLRLCV